LFLPLEVLPRLYLKEVEFLIPLLYWFLISANAKIVLNVIFNNTNGRKYANNLKLTFL